MRKPEAQKRIQAAMKRGFQTRDAEKDLAGCSATWLTVDWLSERSVRAPVLVAASIQCFVTEG